MVISLDIGNTKQVACLFDEMKNTKNAPLLHACGDHTHCGSWCLPKKAKEAGKPYNKPNMFDLSLERDRKTVEIIQVIFDEFTTDFRLQEMRHTHSTQTNKMINMRMCEVAPKWKIFSRTNSLRY